MLFHFPPHSHMSPVGRCGGAQTLLAAIQCSAASIDVGRHMIRQFATCGCCVQPPRGFVCAVAARHCGRPHVLRGRAARAEIASASQSTAHLHVIHAPGHQLIPDLRGAHPIHFRTAQVAIPGPRTRLHGANGSHADGDGHLPTLPAPPFCGLAQRQVLLLPRAHPLRCAL